jgi:uncharacterized protein (TIGR00369 family)
MCEKACPFIRDSLGAKMVALKPGYLEMRLPFKEEFIGNPVSRVLHGGVTAAILDHVGGFAAMSSIPEGKTLMSTVDLRIDYVRPAGAEEMICEAKVTSRNKTMIRADVTCWNPDKTKVIATARGLYNSYPSPINMHEAAKAEAKS